MSDDTHLDHKFERDTVRKNLKRRRWDSFALDLVLRHALDALDRKDARIATLEAEVKGIAENRDAWIAALEAELKEAKSAEDYALGVELRFAEKLAKARKFLADYVDSERNYQSGSPPPIAEVEAFLREVKT